MMTMFMAFGKVSVSRFADTNAYDNQPRQSSPSVSTDAPESLDFWPALSRHQHPLNEPQCPSSASGCQSIGGCVAADADSTQCPC